MSNGSKPALLLGGLVVLVAGCASREVASISHRQAGWLEADSAAAEMASDVRTPDIRPRTYFAAGQLFEQQGDIRKAIIQYRKCIAAAPQYVAAYNRVGVLLGRLGQHPAAEQALRRAIELRPEWAFLHNNLGFEYVLQARWSDAEAEFRHAIQLQPEFARAHNNLAMVLFKTGRADESLNEFRRAVPEADAYYNLGLMLQGQHRYREAADAFEHLLTLAPRFEAAQVQLARIAPHLTPQEVLEPAPELSAWDTLAKAAPSQAPPPSPAAPEKEAPAEPQVPAADAVLEETSLAITEELLATNTHEPLAFDDSGQSLALDFEDCPFEALTESDQDSLPAAEPAVAAAHPSVTAEPDRPEVPAQTSGDLDEPPVATPVVDAHTS
ncbi:MAG: tetratricopeptide repeat protein, partial [Acidobacteriota bacterium]